MVRHYIVSGWIVSPSTRPTPFMQIVGLGPDETLNIEKLAEVQGICLEQVREQAVTPLPDVFNLMITQYQMLETAPGVGHAPCLNI